jgi:hypothetical protein
MLSAAGVAIGCTKLGMGYVAPPTCTQSRPEAIALLALSIILPVTEVVIYWGWFRDSKKAEVRRPCGCGLHAGIRCMPASALQVGSRDGAHMQMG